MFREDLFYRLSVIEVTLPPLRERKRDLPRLANRLLAQFARSANRGAMTMTPEAESAIARHNWPGNLRELRNAIERGVILSRDERLGLADLPVFLSLPPKAGRIEVGSAVTLDTLEAEHIRRVLAAAPSLEEAAITLGIDASTLYRKRRKLGL